MEEANYRLILRDDAAGMSLYFGEPGSGKEKCVAVLSMANDYLKLAEDMRNIADVLDLDHASKQNGKLKDLKDKAIALGLELARVQVERDSLKQALSIMSKQYLEAPHWLDSREKCAANKEFTLEQLVILLVHEYIGGDDE
jgi:hypothetical protein